ncbi:P-loop containing nucleoside triphosphate hydrolase protein [Clavulina sp. PMI_390]|nr:P-loop containing nucleoside triphosphate hydrolase protein [Clavulina sp. PMI_390]
MTDLVTNGVQAVFKILNGADPLTVLTNLTSTATNGTLSDAATDMASNGVSSGGLNLGSLFTLLLSFGAMRDWFKFVLLGGVLESARRLFTTLYYYLWESMLLTVEINSDDPAYDWMHVWLSKQEKWKKARTVELSSRSHNNSRYPEDLPEGEKISLAPTVGTTHTLWYKRRLMRITRNKQQLGDGVTERTIVFTIYSRTHKIIEDLVDEAKKQFESEVDSRICIYVSDQYQNFYMAGSRPKRDIDSVIIPPKMKQFLLSDATDFLASEQWYSQRGIPWQRGYLLYGVPGAGKTSIIQALAGHFGLNIYVISLARRGLDDSGLVDMINGVPRKSIILMEDIDAAFTHSATRETPSNPAEGANPSSAGEAAAVAAMPAMSASSITLSGLLNAIDGVQAQPGRLLFATTNKYEALDPALIRPGRLDVHLEFRKASRWQAEKLFGKFYPKDGSYVDEAEDWELDTGADGEDGELYADDDITKRVKAAEAFGYGDEEGGMISSASSTRVSSPNLSSVALPSTTPHAPTVGGLLSPTSAKFPSTSTSSSSKPSTSSEKEKEKSNSATTTVDIDALAKEFATYVPPNTVSMAVLQGHLMMYKTRPAVAVRRTKAFIKREMERAAAGGGSRMGSPAMRGGGLEVTVTPPTTGSEAVKQEETTTDTTTNGSALGVQIDISAPAEEAPAAASS